MDIEGFEIAALQGASSLIERGRGDLGIVVELHPALWGAAATTRTDLENLLANLGLRCLPLTGQVDTLG